MADIALEQLLHTAGDNTLSQTDGALHGYMRGTDGTATRTVKTDANGNIIISPDSGLGTETTLAALATLLTSLDGKVATDAKLEAARLLLASLNGKDFATQTTLAAVLAKLADPATATKQDAAKGVLDAISTAVATRATDAKLEAARVLLASLDDKDYATQAKQDAAKAVLDAISTAVAARATEATLAQIKTALTDGTQKVQLSGSLLERYGATEAQRPAANTVPTGTVYMAVQTQQMWQSDGSQWVVM